MIVTVLLEFAVGLAGITVMSLLFHRVNQQLHEVRSAAIDVIYAKPTGKDQDLAIAELAALVARQIGAPRPSHIASPPSSPGG